MCVARSANAELALDLAHRSTEKEMERTMEETASEQTKQVDTNTSFETVEEKMVYETNQSLRCTEWPACPMNQAKPILSGLSCIHKINTCIHTYACMHIH